MRKSVVIAGILVVNLILMGVFQSTAQVGNIDFQLIGIEEFDDDAMYDISAVWVGHTSNELAFVIRMFNVSYNPEIKSISVNITLRTQSDELYLIKAVNSSLGDSLILTGADNLETSPTEASNSNPVYYLADRIYFNPYLGEMGIIIDWIDIGGEQPVDFVVWQDSKGNGDRFPNNSSVGYDLTANDRNIDFSAALMGNFETNDPLEGSDAISTTPPSSQFKQDQTTSYEQIDTNTNPGLNTSSITFFLVLLGLVLGMFIFRDRLFGGGDVNQSTDGMPLKQVKSEKVSRTSRNPSKYQSQMGRNENTPKVQVKYIPELGREIRMCCYQTARLNETYCWCGRAIEDDVRQLFSD